MDRPLLLGKQLKSHLSRIPTAYKMRTYLFRDYCEKSKIQRVENDRIVGSIGLSLSETQLLHL